MFKATSGSKPAEPRFEASPGCDTVPGVHGEAGTHCGEDLLSALRAHSKNSLL